MLAAVTLLSAASTAPIQVIIAISPRKAPIHVSYVESYVQIYHRLYCEEQTSTEIADLFVLQPGMILIAPESHGKTLRPADRLLIKDQKIYEVDRSLSDRSLVNHEHAIIYVIDLAAGSFAKLQPKKGVTVRGIPAFHTVKSFEPVPKRIDIGCNSMNS